MPNTLTLTDIANMAIDWCGGALSIQSLDDQQNPLAIICKRNLKQCVRAELDKYEWVFARKFAPAVPVDLEEYPEAEIKGYIAYHLPQDFSRLSLYFFDDFYVYRTNQYQWGHNYFLTSDYLYTRRKLNTLAYCSNEVPITKWHSLFCDIVAIALAERIAGKVQGLDADIQFLNSLYKDKKKDARKLDLIQMEANPTGRSDSQQARLRYIGGII